MTHPLGEKNMTERVFRGFLGLCSIVLAIVITGCQTNSDSASTDIEDNGNGTILEGNFNGYQHLGVPVTDIKVTRAFYQKLGFKEVMGTSIGEGNNLTHVSMMRRAGLTLEFYQPPSKDVTEIGSRNDGHIDHIAFDVNDVDKAFEELTNAGFKPLQKEPVKLGTFWERGCKYFSIRGPDGEILEFNQIL